jgi:hypothetical protein
LSFSLSNWSILISKFFWRLLSSVTEMNLVNFF